MKEILNEGGMNSMNKVISVLSHENGLPRTIEFETETGSISLFNEESEFSVGFNHGDSLDSFKAQAKGDDLEELIDFTDSLIMQGQEDLEILIVQRFKVAPYELAQEGVSLNAEDISKITKLFNKWIGQLVEKRTYDLVKRDFAKLYLDKDFMRGYMPSSKMMVLNNQLTALQSASAPRENGDYYLLEYEFIQRIMKEGFYGED